MEPTHIIIPIDKFENILDELREAKEETANSVIASAYTDAISYLKKYDNKKFKISLPKI